MKKIRIVLVALSAVYVLLTIIFLLNDDSLFNNFNLLKLIDYLQAWIIVGLVLLVGVIVAGSLYIRNLKKENRQLEKDYNAVKARLYDIEEERKTEITRRQTEEEETERKLNAFNQSLKDKNRAGDNYNAGTGRTDPDKNAGFDKRGYQSGDTRPSSDGDTSV